MYNVEYVTGLLQAAWKAEKDTASSNKGSHWYKKVKASNHHLIPLHAISLSFL